ncbi:STAS domain-containing protein [Couchioplanes caeruleus]|uniref:Anti-sigma factor antagonist n=2 Tax=Couchioplanes caeruleus TaxID=56438 RepID=A0A1K0GN74_9ACTN|nr:STAS domain-containing protein [Couchioplanes caeruleus]OJF10651.1 antirepressor [Couchioplanes caeruleus subsp. caeruleus]ROP30728.1 SpoIIAA-like anti-anti-sigma regulatory factor [Couchioplanes caeruleus]
MENPIHSALGADGTAHVTVLGEIDFSNADEVARTIRDAVTEWSPEEVRVDLSDATFIDSTGLGALIEGYRAANEAASRFIVTNPSANLRRVLSVTGLSELFGMPEHEESADLSQATGA